MKGADCFYELGHTEQELYPMGLVKCNEQIPKRKLLFPPLIRTQMP